MADIAVATEETPIDNNINLDFRGADTTYLTHGMHSFPARFPPQIVSWAIDECLGPPSEHAVGDSPIIFDPMVGSGTTIVEAMLKGYRGVGVDIDPLARLMSRVKSRPLPIDELKQQIQALKMQVRTDILHYRKSGGEAEHTLFDKQSSRGVDHVLRAEECPKPDWDRLECWFFPQVIDELALIRERIRRVPESEIREFFEIVFSACLVTKGQSSLVNAYDLAHSRPHRVIPDEVPDTLQRFETELMRKQQTIEEFTHTVAQQNRETGPADAKIVGRDGRKVPLPSDHVDLVVTSPPYINALDYPRATKYALYWLKWTERDYRRQRDKYVGTERIRKDEYTERLQHSTPSRHANLHISNLRQKHPKMAGVIHKFTEDMQLIIREMKRLLKPGHSALMVVGDNQVRGENVATHTILNELAIAEGFHAVRKIPRLLDRDKRQLPVDRGPMNDGVADEWVLHWEKPLS